MTLRNLLTADGIPKATLRPWAFLLIMPGMTESPAHFQGNTSADFRHEQAINMLRGKEFPLAEDFAYYGMSTPEGFEHLQRVTSGSAGTP